MSTVQAPFNGIVKPLSTLDDPVFKAEMVGSGVAVFPAEDIHELKVYAPFGGTIAKAMPHAFIILNNETGVLTHVGIDTVKLDGDGFEVAVKDGQTVNAGDLLVTLNADQVREAGYSLATPIILMDSAPGTIECSCLNQTVSTGAERK